MKTILRLLLLLCPSLVFGAAQAVTVANNNGAATFNTAGVTSYVIGQPVTFTGGTTFNPLPIQASVTTIALLRSYTVTAAIVNGSAIQVTGYYAANDGGGGFYVWNSTSTTADNGGSVIKATAVTTGRWLLQWNGILTPEQFGCKGDGATDDAANFQAGYTAAAGHEFLLAAKTYLIGTQINLAANTLLKGQGPQSIIKETAGFSVSTSILYAISMGNVTVRDLYLDCSAANAIAGVLYDSCTDSQVINVTVYKPYHSGVEYDNTCSRCRITGCTILNPRHTAGFGIVLFHGPQFCSVTGCTVTDYAAYGILVDDSTTGQASAPSNDNVVSDNTLAQVSVTGGFGIGIEGSARNTVEGNIITELGNYAIDLDIGNGSATHGTDLNNVVVGNVINASVNGIRVQGTYNIVKGNRIIAAALGISVQNSGANTDLIYLNSIEGNTIGPVSGGANQSGIQVSDANAVLNRITGNTIFGCAAYGIWLNGGNSTEVVGNTIRNSAKHGILLDTNSTDTTIIRNQIWNSSFGSGAGNYYGIYLNAAGLTFTRLRISDNLFGDDQGTPTQLNGVVALGAGANYTNCLLGDNAAPNPNINPTYYTNASGIANNAAVYVLTISGGAVKPSSARSDVFTCTLTGNVSVSDVDGTPRAGQKISILFLQDGTGGRTVTWGASYKTGWSDTGNTANKRSSIRFVYDGTYWVQDGAQSTYF